MVDILETKTEKAYDHLTSEKSDPTENKVICSLRYCKGITSNSMLSLVLPSYEHLEEVILTLNSMYTVTKKNWDELCAYIDSDKDDYDMDRADYKYACQVYKETADFLKKLHYQDYDKKVIGLIVYYGYIDDGKTVTGSFFNAKKAFHTFPIPKNHEGLDEVYIKLGQRFNLDLLNRNPWFTDEFSLIK